MKNTFKLDNGITTHTAFSATEAATLIRAGVKSGVLPTVYEVRTHTDGRETAKEWHEITPATLEAITYGKLLDSALRALFRAEAEKAAAEMAAAVALMDDEIREAVHADIAPCTDAEFLKEYRRRHYEKYGEAFSF